MQHLNQQTQKLQHNYKKQTKQLKQKKRGGG